MNKRLSIGEPLVDWGRDEAVTIIDENGIGIATFSSRGMAEDFIKTFNLLEIPAHETMQGRLNNIRQVAMSAQEMLSRAEQHIKDLKDSLAAIGEVNRSASRRAA